MEAKSGMLVDKTVAIKNLADAEAIEAGIQVPGLVAQIEALQAVQPQEGVTDGDESGLPAMGGQPGNEGGDAAAGAGPAALDTGAVGDDDLGSPAFPEGADYGGEPADGPEQPEAGGV
jgi:hypothetical protein